MRRDVDFLFFETLKSVERNFSQQVGASREGRKQKERAEVWCDDEEKKVRGAMRAMILILNDITHEKRSNIHNTNSILSARSAALAAKVGGGAGKLTAALFAKFGRPSDRGGVDVRDEFRFVQLVLVVVVRVESSLNGDTVELATDVVNAVGGVAVDVVHKRVLVVIVHSVVVVVVAIFVNAASLETEAIDNWRAAVLRFW